MITDRELKRILKDKARDDPEKYYPFDSLKGLGFVRKECKLCSTFFWSMDKGREICGDSQCEGGFLFIGDSPAKKSLDYISVWKEYSKIHKEMGYTPIERYPVVARWNPTTDFTMASIAAFQPFVVSGEVDPPANPLVIPQFCVRFNDIDNVGITGAHYVGFVMLGEHAFMPPEKYDINRYFKDHLRWLNEGLGLANKDITVHEDAWAGGGNFGPCVEFFSRGLELSNQVYMQYELDKDDNWKELNIKVLDMGQGYERIPWFTQAKSTSYETTFPTVMEALRKSTDIRLDEDLMTKFLPYSALLNVDEAGDTDKVWKFIASKIGVEKEYLKEHILESAALYSIAEHSRALLFTLADGALPSNTGGYYNLRVIYRRAASFIDRYGWNIDIPEICFLHAQYLKPLFPELLDRIEDVRKILGVEKIKYENNKKRSEEIIDRIISENKTVDDSLLFELYESHGISPELVRDKLISRGIKIDVPDNFYSSVSSRHDMKKKEGDAYIIGIDLKDIPPTISLYYDDWRKDSCSSRVLKIEKNYLILDRSVFYPSAGGQDHDTGWIDKIPVIDVIKEGQHILHKLDDISRFSVGDEVLCRIDIRRREQLTQHHTVAHIINAAARKVLGNHINQAGAKKSMDKGHLDITHYSGLSEDETARIEVEANDTVKKGIRIKKIFMPRGEAERRYGVRIYQGGVAPGKELRIVEIPGVDVEACGGTHLNDTSEAGAIKITGSVKIQDGIIRLEYTAGRAAEDYIIRYGDIKKKVSDMLSRELDMTVKFDIRSLEKAGRIFQVTIYQLIPTLDKFIKGYISAVRFLEKHNIPAENKFNSITFEELSKEIFDRWKLMNKRAEDLRRDIAKEKTAQYHEGSVDTEADMDKDIMTKIAENFDEILLVNKEGMFVFKGSEERFNLLKKLGAKGGGKGIKQGIIPKDKIPLAAEKLKPPV